MFGKKLSEYIQFEGAVDPDRSGLGDPFGHVSGGNLIRYNQMGQHQYRSSGRPRLLLDWSTDLGIWKL